MEVSGHLRTPAVLAARENQRYTMQRRIGGPQSRPGGFWEENNLAGTGNERNGVSSVRMNQEIEIKHLEASDLPKRGQSRFVGCRNISQSSVSMNQEIEIKHLETSDLPKRGQSRFVGCRDISQSYVFVNQEIEIKHLEASDLNSVQLPVYFILLYLMIGTTYPNVCNWFELFVYLKALFQFKKLFFLIYRS
jgi:hypothetical protein